MKKNIKCSVVGARGYAGQETARILLRHPQADLTHCFATSAFDLAQSLKSPKASRVKCLADSEILHQDSEVVFLATPAEVSMELASELIKKGQKVIDLSGAFRLKKSSYKQWYGFEHTQASLLINAQYGLAPFARPQKTSLVANPGCYATAVSMALIPMIRDHLVDASSIVIDAKSGTTGAGKKAAENLLFSEVEGECLPYKVGRHQHYPEIVEAIANFGGQEINAHMTTSLLPTRRGIIAGIYAHLENGVGLREVSAAFSKTYKDYPLVSFGEGNENAELLRLKQVIGTGRTHLSYFVDGQKLYLFSCIDNLMKGAASQAIENFNRLYDLPLGTGIENLEAVT